MNRYASIGNAPGLGWDGYDDDGIEVQPLVDALTRDDLRDLRDDWRNKFARATYRPRFGTWTRDLLCDMEWDRRRHSGDE